MPHSRSLWRLIQLLVLICLGLNIRSDADGQGPPRLLRIGLKTAQPEVRLQGTAPLEVRGASGAAITVPAASPLTIRADGESLVVTDAAAAELLRTTAPLTVRPALLPPPDRQRAPEAPAPLPTIALLGPTRHYDGRADRPYRGEMHLLARPEGLTVVNIVEVEAYLWGVVSSEMSPSYPLEALKAQAVAARTYALRNLGRLQAQGFDLDDTPACQVYGGVWNEHPRTTQAVNDTAGRVLRAQGEIIDAVYSSTCGGYTETAEGAWGRAVPYLVSVSDTPEEIAAASPYPTDEAGWTGYFKSTKARHCLQPRHANPEAYRWVRLMTRKELEAGLPPDYGVGTLQNIVPLARGTSGRLLAVRLEGTARSVTITKELTIRKALGKLRSSAFVVDTYRDDNDLPVVFAFWGAGWGHGLGMCQVGAVGLAEQGWPYDRILAHYYRGTTLERL
jgi:stage II sporulation protein D